jgi:hypothetical protein
LHKFGCEEALAEGVYLAGDGFQFGDGGGSLGFQVGLVAGGHFEDEGGGAEA